MLRSTVILLVVVLSIGALALQGLEWFGWRDHDDYEMVKLAVGEALDEPNGSNYARAIKIERASDRPEDEKNYKIGLLILGSYESSKSRRPPETLQQGLALVEQAAVKPSDPPLYAAQQLRLIFERGVGTPPLSIPADQVVAGCWHKLEFGGKGNPAHCVALRRERLPQLSERAIGSGSGAKTTQSVARLSRHGPKP